MNLLLLAGLLVFLWKDGYMPKRDKKIILICIILAMVLEIDGLAGAYLSQPERIHLIDLRRIEGFIGYIIRPLLLWGLWELLRGSHKRYLRVVFGGLSVGNILVFSTCFSERFNVVFGYHADTYQWYRRPLGLTAHYIMGIMMILFVPILVEMFIRKKRQDFLMGLISLLLILISTLCDTYLDQNMLQGAIVCECVWYMLFLHVQMEKEYMESIRISQKAEMMLMQIRPHFINNALGTIQALCEIDPPLAAQATGDFAKYLRGNLTVMDKPLPIPIQEEIEHIKAYMAIETLRFPWIEVEYDIQDPNFCVPALSVQPLVENAVQHGLRRKKHGKVTIRTQYTDRGHQVEVIDDGIGFDAEKIQPKKGHGVGIRNVRYRIEKISNGSITVESTPGQGTRIIMYIP